MASEELEEMTVTMRVKVPAGSDPDYVAEELIARIDSAGYGESDGILRDATTPFVSREAQRISPSF